MDNPMGRSIFRQDQQVQASQLHRDLHPDLRTLPPPIANGNFAAADAAAAIGATLAQASLRDAD